MTSASSASTDRHCMDYYDHNPRIVRLEDVAKEAQQAMSDAAVRTERVNNLIEDVKGIKVDVRTLADSFQRFAVEYASKQTSEPKGEKRPSGFIDSVNNLRPMYFISIIIVVGLIFTGQFFMFTQKIIDRIDKVTINPQIRI